MEQNKIESHHYSINALTWGELDDQELPPVHEVDVLIAADVFYHVADFEDIVVSIKAVLLRNRKAVCYVVYQERK
jgi:hypothetical protein